MNRFLFLILIHGFCLLAKASSTPTPSPSKEAGPATSGGTLIQQTPLFLQFNPNPTAKESTERMVDAHERSVASGVRNPGDVTREIQDGRARADQMLNALRDEQFQKALKKVTRDGEAYLQENKGLMGPASFVAGAAAFWFGATVNLFKGDSLKIDTRVEARNRTSEFRLESPLLNSRLVFGPVHGVELNVNRSIASLGSRAELNYFGNTGSLSTQITHPLAPNLNLSIGTSQIPELNNRTDGRAKIEYQIHF